ncbi:MAG: TIGR01777 family oxidoreductase [Bacteroidales bacterium]|jgi:uncharacterized protein (TIGR01777 family)|nr:TIGR01777 family oxidoreductase [Bacteroidales bacterium]
MKNIAIFGATGFIGKALTQYLLDKNLKVTAITRNKDKARQTLDERTEVFQWDYNNVLKLSELLAQTDVIINLAGANIASRLWTQKHKQKILSSRINAGKKITEAVKHAKHKPELMIQGSAIGYYGYDTQGECNEKSPKGDGFLAEVTDQWEKSTREIESMGVRRVIIRTGMVLGNSGGIFPRLKKPIQWFAGANLGSGKQWFSWIHLTDEIRAIEYLINHHQMAGIFNLTAPFPVSSKTFNQTVAKLLNRPIWLSIPKFLFALIPGNMGIEVFLASQQVIPSHLQASGFKFTYPRLTEAVNHLVKN